VTGTFESPTDLLHRILKTDVVMFMIEAGSRLPPPFPIPVYTPAEYYSLMAAEREDYHKLQQMFDGKIEVPGLAATMPAQAEDRVSQNSMHVGFFSISAPPTRTVSPGVVRRAQSWPEPGGWSGSSGSSDAESVDSVETLIGRPSPTEYEAFAKENPCLSHASSVYGGESVDLEETLVGWPSPIEYEEFAKENPHLAS